MYVYCRNISEIIKNNALFWMLTTCGFRPIYIVYIHVVLYVCPCTSTVLYILYILYISCTLLYMYLVRMYTAHKQLSQDNFPTRGGAEFHMQETPSSSPRHACNSPHLPFPACRYAATIGCTQYICRHTKATKYITFFSLCLSPKGSLTVG